MVVCWQATGLVTTTRITHASPAGNYAHTSEREWESDGSMSMSSSSCTDIAYQMVYDEPGKNCKVSGFGIVLRFNREKVIFYFYFFVCESEAGL